MRLVPEMLRRGWRTTRVRSVTLAATRASRVCIAARAGCRATSWLVPGAALPVAVYTAVGGGRAECDAACIADIQSSDAATACSALRGISRDLSSDAVIAEFVQGGGLDALAGVLLATKNREPKQDALELIAELMTRGAAAQVCSSRCVPSLLSCAMAEGNSKLSLHALRCLRKLALSEPVALSTRSDFVTAIVACLGAENDPYCV